MLTDNKVQGSVNWSENVWEIGYCIKMTYHLLNDIYFVIRKYFQILEHITPQGLRSPYCNASPAIIIKLIYSENLQGARTLTFIIIIFCRVYFHWNPSCNEFISMHKISPSKSSEKCERKPFQVMHFRELSKKNNPFPMWKINE